jgi:peptidyl-prolyl cis-trans isomerase C
VAGSLAEARAEAARTIVVRELLLSEARRLGIVAKPIVTASGRMETASEAMVRELIETVVTIDEPAEAACRAEYDRRPDRYRSPDQIGAEHILIAACPRDRYAYAAAIQKAVDLIAEIGRDPDRFAALARTLSDCPSRVSGGRLGLLRRGDTVPEFETFLFALDEGELCPVPVKTRFGVHVVRAVCRVEGQRLSYELAQGRAADRLRARLRRRAVRSYIRSLVACAAIRGAAFPKLVATP